MATHEAKYDGVWCNCRVVAEVPAGTKVFFMEDNTTWVVDKDIVATHLRDLPPDRLQQSSRCVGDADNEDEAEVDEVLRDNDDDESGEGLKRPSVDKKGEDREASFTKVRKYMGVRQVESGRWRATIHSPNGSRNVSLGTFKRQMDAVRAYDAAARKFGKQTSFENVGEEDEEEEEEDDDDAARR